MEQIQLELDIGGEDAAICLQRASNVVVLRQYLLNRERVSEGNTLDPAALQERSDLVKSVLGSVDDVWQHLDVM